MFVLPTSILYVSPQPPPQVHITDLIMRGNSAQQKRIANNHEGLQPGQLFCGRRLTL